MFEHSLKNAYIGEVKEKSIDLRGKTLAEVQAEWWDVVSWNWSYNLNSNWLTTVTSANNWVELYTPITLTAWNKVTINLTGSWTRLSSQYNYGYNSILKWGVGTVLWNEWTPLFCWALNTWSIWGATWFEYNDGLVWTDWPHTAWWDFEMTLTFDLSTWEATYTLTWAMSHTATMTLTSAQISGILSINYFRYRIGIYNNSNTAILKTASFRIEE